jgi:iron complex transport system substrate-binding protein
LIVYPFAPAGGFVLKEARVRRKTLWLSVICLTGALALLLACTPSPEGAQPAPALDGGFPLELTDQAGRLVRIEKVPEKIISLAPGNTEIVYALGLEDRLVGVTEYCDYPEAAREKPKIGGFSTVDIEKVVAIEPDLILATNIHEEEVIPQLERLGLTVLTLDPTTLDDVLESIRLAGKFTGTTEAANGLVVDMETRIRAVTDKTAQLSAAQRPRVLYVLWYDPLTTAGGDTRIHDLVVKAGGSNIASDLTGYPDMGLEAIISINPQVIIAGQSHGSVAEANYQFVVNEKRLEDTDALKDERIYQIDSDLSSRPGPRIIQGLELFAEFIHPELFPGE